MDKDRALPILAALSQPTRFDTFRKLVAAAEPGMTAGTIAITVGVSPSNLSTHLAILSRAGLITSEKVGRVVTYRAVPEAVTAVSEFLSATLKGR